MLNPLLRMLNVYKQQLGQHKVHDQLHIGMSLPINVLTCHVKPSYKSTEGEIQCIIHTALSLSVNVTETYVDAYELFTRLVWEYIHSSTYDTATLVMHHSTLEWGNAYMLINSTLHKRTLCTHWTGQNHLSPNITPIECHYRTMYSSCSEKENTLTF